MKKRIAVYAGSFDPITLGHLWMIEQGVKLFDKLIVAIGVNPEKHCTFSIEERLEMIRLSTGHFSNIKVSSYVNQFLVNYAKSVNAKFILRGIRTESDYDYERIFRNVNNGLAPTITTVLLQPPPEIADISSSMVKGLVGPEGWEEIVKMYVPEPVFKKLKEKHDAKSN